MGSIDRDRILRRVEKQTLLTGDETQWEISPNRGDPRWRVDARWIEFECGCRAERCAKLYDYYPWEPVIFYGLPEQAVYEGVCDFHAPSMNKRIGTGHKYKDFASWRMLRRNVLMGK